MNPFITGCPDAGLTMFGNIRTDERHTVRACYTAYVIQAIIVTFAPLLFITFSDEFSLSLERITLLTTVNFSDRSC